MSRICSPRPAAIWCSSAVAMVVKCYSTFTALQNWGRDRGKKEEGNKLLRSDVVGLADEERGRGREGGRECSDFSRPTTTTKKPSCVLRFLVASCAVGLLRSGLSFRFPRDKLDVGNKKGKDMGGKFEFRNCLFILLLFIRDETWLSRNVSVHNTLGQKRSEESTDSPFIWTWSVVEKWDKTLELLLKGR